MNLWQIILLVFLFALWVWALVAVFIDVFRRSDLSGAIREADGARTALSRFLRRGGALGFRAHRRTDRRPRPPSL